MYEEIAPVVDSVEITSPTSFSFAGEPIQVYTGHMPTMPGYPSHPLPPSPLVRDIQGILYNRCYTRRIGDPVWDDAPRPRQQTAGVTQQAAGAAQPAAPNQTPAAAAVTPATPMPSDELAQKLSASNNTQTRWDAGWSVYAVGPAGQVYVQKGERQRASMPGEFMSSGPPGLPPTVGAVVSLLVQRDALNAQPGLYFAYGDTLSDLWDEFALLRFYFHTPASAAPDLFAYLTGALNRFHIPFRLKTPVVTEHYFRTDAAVLYVAKRYYTITARLVMEMPDGLASRLRDSVPLFTKRLRAGVGLAEEPNTGESFGMHRCRLTAEGIVGAWMRGERSTETRVRSVGACFEANNLSLDRPYLNAGSQDLFEVPEEPALRA